MLKKLFYIFFIFLFSLSLKCDDEFIFGLGGSFISYPSYIGSKKQNNLLLPFPYIKYSNKYINVDRDKIYNEIYNTDNTKIEISLRGMFPSKSDNTAREGMPDLDAILEIGPKITHNLFTNNKMKIDLEVPFRGAFSIGNRLFNYEGFYTSFDLSYKNKIFNDFNLIFNNGISYSNETLNNYYYEIDSIYTNPNRNEYHSKSGYSGFHTSLAITKKDEKFWYGAFIKHYSLKNSVFENSDLVEKNYSLLYGLAFSYLF